MPAHVLGIDVGTGGTRALIVDEAGRILASATEEHAPFASPQIGWAEQDPEDWWRACGIAVRKALAGAALRSDQIACVGFSGQMHGAVMLDEADQVVRPALIWCDVRTEKQCRELTDKIGAQELIRLTCNPALPNFTLTKFLWVRENEPQNWKRVRSVMLPKDYVRFRLTGERATDMADASGTLLLDVANRRWSREVMQAAGIEESLLPRLFESPDICGKISPSGRRCYRIAGGYAGRGRRGRSGGGRGRHGNRGARRSERNHRNLRSRLRRHRPSVPRRQGKAAHFLPCGSRALARHGSDPGCRPFAALVSRHLWRGRGRCETTSAIPTSASPPRLPQYRPDPTASCGPLT